MRSRIVLSCVVVFLATVRVAFAEPQTEVAFADPCAHVEPSAPIPFHGRQLVSSPDIKAPELRLIDAMIDTKGCFQHAEERLARYKSANPDDYHAAFAEARITWLSGNPQQAYQDLQSVVHLHRDFAAAKQLLASLSADLGDAASAEALLRQVEDASPNDLWAYLRRLSNAVTKDGTAPEAAELLAILRDKRFPLNAREFAAQTLTKVSNVPVATREAAYVEELKFDSVTPRSMKVTNFGRFVIEDRSDYARGRRILQKSLRDTNDAKAHDYATLLIAESYLLEAYDVSPTRTNANAELIENARATLDGDFSPLDERIAARPALRKLRPLLGHVDAGPAADGRSALCVAVMNLDLERVQEALDAGAEVDAPCVDTTALGMAVKTLTSDLRPQAAIIEQLLQHGADPNPTLYAHSKETALSFCHPRDYPACAKELRPLLEKYNAARAGETRKPTSTNP